ncbi:MAG TPA: hypothetical protein VLB00_08385 [Gemmatimonadales bacterium]|jgi:hypothetical protein|nr:hypothetical protein [Gemmatimonadales bacterium]
MRRRHLVPTLILLGCVALGWEIGGADRFGTRSFEAQEADRLRLHFAEVEREMLSRDISDLTPAQQVARAEQIVQLRRYSSAGAFPSNTYHPGKRTPYFRDARGNLCAMAFLIAASGRGDIVDHIARNRNYAFVPDLIDEPGLAEWLGEHGLTVEEAARIQPTYGGEPSYQGEPSAGYLAATTAASGVSVVSVVWNARSMDRLAGHRTRGAVGLVSGGINLALGLAKIGSDGGPDRAFGVWNLAVGTVAAIYGARAITAPPRRTMSVSRLRIAPVASVGKRPALGFAARFRL